MGIIYLARCKVNGKCYVGKTKGTLEARMEGHQRDAFNGDSRVFQRAIRKYGWDAFEWTILYEDEDDDREWMDWWEQRFIKKLNTKMPNGYNMTDGGEGGPIRLGSHHTEESKKKISEKMKGRPSEKKGRPGKKRTVEQSEKWRNAVSVDGKSPFFGKKHTKEAKQKISEAAKKRPVDLSRLEKMWKSRRGVPLSEETKERIRKARTEQELQKRKNKEVGRPTVGGLLLVQ